MTVYIRFKFFFLASLLAAYIITCLPIFPFFYLTPQSYRKLNARIVSWYSSLFLKVLGCRIRVNQLPSRLNRNYLLVSNHLSYLDILIISSCFPGCYVTSQEIREMPFLGTITSLAGCLYVERRSRTNLKNEISEITCAIQHGLNVIIFPEGTSTNGEQVLRFRQPLFQSAIDSNKKIVPLSITYTQIDNKPVTTENRDRIFWYDDMTFPDHFAGLAAINHLDVSVHVSCPIRAVKAHSCAYLSQKAHTAVKSKFTPVLT